ncbi:uncharacterized mitochondrial protein AtMg00810-like [Lycium barbarum]|uniref:uncharacterized mitochondrial protein AtMg00810-like n=1 Tax=Lycium barbarum TaxID=112863 RepID=UPI00293E0486|nr:uncharacterized mitochondrial protein AtMg00810-like [Lycium barbarum]
MELLHESGGVVVTQRKFALKLLSELDCEDAQSISTPLDPTMKLTSDFGTPLADPTIYRRLIGKLNFLTNMRPDLSFTVQTLRQYMQSLLPVLFNWDTDVILRVNKEPIYQGF